MASTVGSRRPRKIRCTLRWRITRSRSGRAGLRPRHKLRAVPYEMTRARADSKVRPRFSLVFETVTGHVDENVFERRLAERDGTDLADEGFDELRNELVAALALDAEGRVELLSGDIEPVLQRGGQALWVIGGERNHVGGDAAFQGGRRVAGGDLPGVHDRQPIAMLGLVHQVRGDQDRDLRFGADLAEVAPQVDARPGIQA